MNVLATILNLFVIDSNKTKQHEHFDVAEVSVIASRISIPNESEIICSTKLILDSDSYSISIEVGYADAITYSMGISSYEDFSSELRIKIENLSVNEKILVSVKIFKDTTNQRIRIYLLEKFADYLEELSYENLINLFSNEIKRRGGIVFITDEITENCGSDIIKFIGINDCNEIYIDQNKRNRRLSTIRSITNTTVLSNNEIISDDFIFNEICSHDRVQEKFNELAFILSVIAMFDNTVLSASQLTYQLNGYRTIKSSIDLKQIDKNKLYSSYINVYKWIYSGGNLTDKIGLARNILSLHLVDPKNLSLRENAYESILSSYKIYEKQNIKQYVEIRNKMSDQLLDYNKKASQIVDTFGNSFQKSSLGVTTLFSSIIAAKVLSTSTPTDRFIYYATILSIAFLIISLIYMLISRWEVKKQKERFISSYINFKQRYTDLLTVEDINRILNNDKEFNVDTDFIKSKVKAYTALWCCVLSIVFIIIVLYYILI